MYKVIILLVGFHGLAQICCAQDSITTNDVKVIKAKAEIIVGRYYYNLLNTISYAGAESSDIKELINQSFRDSAKQLFLNDQIAIADDISDPEYSNSYAPELPAIQYLNAFNTFYGKTDSNSVSIKDVRTSPVKRGKTNIYINVYFTSFFRNMCLPHPATLYKPANRVAEILIKRSNNNKWLLYISRIGFFNPADTLNDNLDNILVVSAKTPYESFGLIDETLDSADKFDLYTNQARIEENKRNYPAAINLYTRAIELAPGKKNFYEPRIKELKTSFRILDDLERKYKAGDYKAAIKGYTELLKNPDLNSRYSNSDYYFGRAKCFDKMGQLTKSYNEQVRNYTDALKDYNKACEYDKDNMDAIRHREDLYSRMNQL